MISLSSFCPDIQLFSSSKVALSNPRSESTNSALLTSNSNFAPSPPFPPSVLLLLHLLILLQFLLLLLLRLILQLEYSHTAMCSHRKAARRNFKVILNHVCDQQHHLALNPFNLHHIYCRGANALEQLSGLGK